MKTKTTQPAPECLCGCGASTKGGRFLPGHDAKLKKTLIEAALGGSKRAANKLENLGWTKFLEAKREKDRGIKRPEVDSEVVHRPDAPKRRRRPPKSNQLAPKQNRTMESDTTAESVACQDAN